MLQMNKQDFMSRFGCIVCGDVRDTYMVHDHVWTEAGLKFTDNACLECFERKLLKRKLTLADFKDVKCNNAIRWAFKRGQEHKNDA